MNTGKNNSLTDVEGLIVGHFTDTQAACGVSVAICQEGATAGVDVRGSAPGTRETDLLAPINLVEKAQAIVLTGGSVYGLSSADGVVRWLSNKGWGFPLEAGNVAPIVPAAALFDLGRGKDYIPPIEAAWGTKACENAGPEAFPIGCVGAGTGALSGGIKGGLGTASEVLASGLTVAAMVAVNSLGSVIDPATGQPWEIRMEQGEEFGKQGKRSVLFPVPPKAEAGRNTTIGIIATDAVLTKAQAQKIAQMAHDGMARAIRPAHTMFDGDTIFCMATNKKELPDTPGFFVAPKAMALIDVGRAAADCMTRAIIQAIFAATSSHNMIAFRDLENR